jgi:hypothetical protein
MGQIADSLRATLRELAQSDARLYRGLQQELSTETSLPRQTNPMLLGEARATREDLEGLSIKVLWTLCKARGLTGLSKGPQEAQVEALLGHPEGPPLRSALPVKVTKGSKGGVTGDKAAAKAASNDVQALEQRLDRLEQLVLLIAQQVGVPHEAIARLLPPAAPPT